jgi:hypothetical protein|tara:strand:- start:2536 stop:3645 length:1110 start_codon:yes stop_codon:yes gene_type:complete
MNLAQKIKDIHESIFKFVIVSSGGGSNAIGTLLKVPGASNSILEAYIPYAKESLDFYLMKRPDSYCSLDTTTRMAARAYSAAKKIDQKSDIKNLFGVAITASLSTNYKKKGDHRFHIAVQTRDFSKSISCVIEKGSRTREKEEELVTEYVIALISDCCGFEFEYPSISEVPEYININAEQGWADLMSEKIEFVPSSNNQPKLIFPGAFNPMHDGHVAMSKLAEKETGQKTFFEICIQNVDKPPLSYHQIDKTISQFSSSQDWVLTKAGKFSDKAKLFPNSTFIIGADTLVRIFDERFYASRRDMLAEFDIFNQNKNQFLVFGRKYQNKFIELKDVQLPDPISGLFKGFGEDIFREDISSSSIRQENTEE